MGRFPLSLIACLSIVLLAGCSSIPEAAKDASYPDDYLLSPYAENPLQLAAWSEAQDIVGEYGASSNPGEADPIFWSGEDGSLPEPAEAWVELLAVGDGEASVFVTALRFASFADFSSWFDVVGCANDGHPASYMLQAGPRVVVIEPVDVETIEEAQAIQDAADRLIARTLFQDTVCPVNRELVED